MNTSKTLPKPPRIPSNSDEKNTSEKTVILTPGQRALLDGTANPVIPLIIDRFGLDICYSSLEALDALRISHTVDTIFASLSGSPPPPPLDLSVYAPLSPTDERRRQERLRQKKLNALPRGITLDSAGNTTFDMQWKTKGIYITELPTNHPDYCPF